MTDWNLYAAWLGILLGFTSGTVQGIFFHDEKWLGGYASWRRRMTRLGHISFLGLAFVNLAFVLTIEYRRIESGVAWPSVLFLIGAFSMPLICYLSAWKAEARRLFFIPVLSLVGAALIMLCLVMR